MKQNRLPCGIFVALLTLGTALACGKDQDKEKTPTVSVGGADDSGGGDGGNATGGASESGGAGAKGGSGGKGGTGGTEASTFANGGAGGATTPTTGADGCFLHPKTHLEIINACTEATKINKVSKLNAAGFDAKGELLAPSALSAL